MKVALISLARRGGMVHYHQELAKSLAHLTPIVVVCAAGVAPSYFPKGVPRWAIDTGHDSVSSLLKAANPATWYRIVRLLRKVEADVYHIVAPHEWNPIVACAVRLTGKPLIYTVHDPMPHRGAPIRMRISNAVLVRMADALVALTRLGRAQLAGTGLDSRRLFLIPMMVHLAFAAQARVRSRSRKIFLFFGRIEPYKGLQILLSAFKRARQQLDGWQLLIAGSGPFPDGAISQPASGIRILNRYIADREVADIISQAGVVVLPYLDATQSGVIAIAAALGKPVIATRVGGLPEMVIHGKTGLVVPPNNVDALSRAMVSLARHPARRKRLGRRARQMGRSRWSPLLISRLHLAMYSSVVGGGGTP